MEWLDINSEDGYETTPLTDDNDWKEIGNNIRKKRKKHKWTQEELAGRICSDRNIVSRHENAEVQITLESLLKYAIVFDCGLSDLLPVRFRDKDKDSMNQLKGLTPGLYATMCLLSTMPVEKQETMNRAIQSILDFAA